MKTRSRILAGTALGVLIASAPLVASAGDYGRPEPSLSGDMTSAPPRYLAQAEGGDEQSGEQVLKKKRKHREPAPGQASEQSAPKQAPAQQMAPEQAPAQAVAPPKAVPGKVVPAGEKQAKRKQKRQAPAEQPAEMAPEQAPAQAVAPPKAVPGKVVPAGEKQAKRKQKRQAPAEQPAEMAPEQAPAQAVAPPKAVPGKVVPAGEKQAKRKQKRQAPAEQPAEIAPDQAPAQAVAPPKAAPGEAAPGKKQAKQDKGKQQAPAEKPGPEPEQAAQPEAPVAEQPAQSVEQPGQPGKASASTGQAPVLDSQKHSAPESKQAAQRPQQAQPAEPTSPPPADDRAAQQKVQPARIQPVTAEKGTRIDLKPEQAARRVRPQGVEVVREFGERTIVQVNNQIIVQSNDRPRIAYGARDVYYEELPRGRVREVIVREDGSRVVTIRDRYGDVVRRSRFTPDGREYVLVYVDEGYYDRVGEWRDPGLDLPPMWLTIPPEEYILDADSVDDLDAYYAFLEQPPVEPVERLYSIDEVKRSARIRDKVRRIDLDTVNFAFGSAEIEESEIPKLEGVAQAMQRLLEESPAETFLIEGHTDAVGSDDANLVLSDKRAEAVANALTNVFAIAPENLAPQGYGEQFLKVNTQERERENRRVAIRRVTPLVAPVASAD